MSAFGGVICLNRPVDRELAEAVTGQFAELVFAPHFDEAALEVFAAKPNLRVLEDDERRAISPSSPRSSRSSAAFSSRIETSTSRSAATWRSSTRRRPTEQEWSEMLFALEGVQARALQRDRPREGARAPSGSARGR